MQQIIEWVSSQGTWAPLFFILVYVGAAICFVPGSILTLLAGAIFGVVQGVILVSISSTSAAAISFLLGRFALRGWIEKKLSHKPSFNAIDKAVGREGGKIVFLLRLSPVFPFTLLNYGLGLTKIKFRSAIFASWLGMLPGTILYVYIGSLAQVAAQETTTAQKVLYGIGLLATLIVTVMLTKIAKRALSSEIDNPSNTQNKKTNHE